MATGDTIIPDKQSAVAYDEQARVTHWFGPEVVFGLTYEFIKPGDSLLDLGIGSGLSSILFHKAGVHIYGLDGSSDILEICASKGFATEVKQHDLRDLPLPYTSHFFDHVISVAVLNSFQDLEALLQEIARIIKRHGIFAFTVEDQQPGQGGSYAINRVDVSEKARDEMAVTLFRHRGEYIAHLLDQNGFFLLKALEFLAFKYPAEHRDVFFKAYVARNIGSNQERT
jgi:predicted TPR repeat methyltransferase